ncbi:DUF4174 domain-containing protein [Ningiella sp. W23]|uniref:DUF4174 domain-containing protein n=1 Tax=Ningiella sp. W23 TaxID=3023715 RepID=UPI003756C9EB
MLFFRDFGLCFSMTACLVIFSLGISTVASASTNDDANTQSLADMRYEYRVLIISHEPHENIKLAEMLERDEDELVARKLRVFLFNPQAEQAQISEWNGQAMGTTLKSEIQQSSEAGKSVLIGLDGFKKGTFTNEQLNDVFAAIDRMPMRRAEMNRN